MKMPNIISKNKSLATVVLVTFFAALFLIFECFVVQSKIQEGMAAIEKADREIQNINRRKNPNPVKASSVIINKNSTALRNKIDELYRAFGNPYRKALLAFIKDLNVKQGDIDFAYNESSIIALFRERWEEYYRNNTREAQPNDKRVLVDDRNQIFKDFVKALTAAPVNKSFANDQEKKAWEGRALKVFDNAFAKFHADLKRTSLEGSKISLEDAQHILMQSFGLPRTMSSQQCKVYIDDVQLNLERELSYLIPGLRYTVSQDGKRVPATRAQMHTRILEFAYNHRNMLPPPGNVESILNHYTIIEDLFKRMTRSNIQVLMTLGSPFSSKPSGDPAGDIIRYSDSEQDMDTTFKKYVYEITVRSTVDQVRAFVNELHNAFADNRVYEVEEMSFHRDPSMNEVKAANDALVKARSDREKDNDKKNETDANGADNTSYVAKKKVYTRAEKEHIYSEDNYGKIVIGADKGSSMIIAYIKVNYLVYTGNLIEKK